MAKVRAQRRAEKERLAAVAAAAREEEAARAVRQAARRRALTGWVPRPAPKQVGIIAERRRRQVAVIIAIVVALNVLVYFCTGDWALRALVLCASLLGAPVLHTLMFRKS